MHTVYDTIHTWHLRQQRADRPMSPPYSVYTFEVSSIQGVLSRGAALQYLSIVICPTLHWVLRVIETHPQPIQPIKYTAPWRHRQWNTSGQTFKFPTERQLQQNQFWTPVKRVDIGVGTHIQSLIRCESTTSTRLHCTKQTVRLSNATYAQDTEANGMWWLTVPS